MAQLTDEALSGRVRLEIVAAGNGWWINAGPDPSDIATYIFVDASEHPRLLLLPGRVSSGELTAAATWAAEKRLLMIALEGPTPFELEIKTERPELEAVRRARVLFICPTTPKIGVSPYLARDRSFSVELPRSAVS
jgi:hypothetical protein